MRLKERWRQHDLKSLFMTDDLYCINNTLKVNRGLDEHNIQHECGKEIYMYNIFVRNFRRKKPLKRLTHKRQNDNKRYLKETGCGSVKWIDQDRI